MKEKLIKALQTIEIDDVTDTIWNDVPAIDEQATHVGLNCGLIRVEEGADSYIMGVYFSHKLGESIILDWGVREQYKSLEELAETIIAIEKNGKAIEAALEYSQERYYQIINYQNQAKDKEQSHDHER